MTLPSSVTHVILLLILTWPGTVMAHTRAFGGYILTVTPEADAARMGSGSISVLRTWSSDFGDYSPFTIPIGKNYVCVLDGKKLDPAEFLKTVKPGMAIRALTDLYYIRAYSDPGFLPARPDAVLGVHGALSVRLQRIGSMVCTKSGEQPDAKGKDAKNPDCILQVALEGGKVVGGVAITPLFGQPWQGVDLSDLTYQAGRLTGRVKSTLRFNGFAIDGKATKECLFTLDVRVARDGAVSGSYTGTVGEKKSEGKVEGQAQIARDTSGDLGVWVRLDYDVAADSTDQGGAGRWTFVRKNNVFVGGPAVVTHNYTSAMVEKGMLQVDGISFKAEIAPQGGRDNVQGTFTLKGQIAGDMMYGTFTDAAGRTGRCRGEIRRPDAPPAWAWNEPILKKQIAKGEYPE